jgi:hypothetical protein
MMTIGRGLPVVLSVTAAALCLVIAGELSGTGQGDGTSPVAASLTSGPLPDRAEAPEAPDQHETWLNQILARPLFSPDRHPVEVGVRGLPRLAGIIVAGSQRVAIFAAPSNGHPIVAPAGAHIGAYEVRTITDSGVTVVGPEGTTTIRPAFDPARPAAPEPRPGNLQPARIAPK